MLRRRSAQVCEECSSWVQDLSELIGLFPFFWDIALVMRSAGLSWVDTLQTRRRLVPFSAIPALWASSTQYVSFCQVFVAMTDGFCMRLVLVFSISSVVTISWIRKGLSCKSYPFSNFRFIAGSLPSSPVLYKCTASCMFNLSFTCAGRYSTFDSGPVIRKLWMCLPAFFSTCSRLGSKQLNKQPSYCDCFICIEFVRTFALYVSQASGVSLGPGDANTASQM